MSQIISLPKEKIMAEKKSYNHLALRGAPVDDMEFVEQFGLDPAIAYTNEINMVMLDKLEQDNINFYIEDEGLDNDVAIQKAAENKEKAWKDIKILLAKNGMLK